METVFRVVSLEEKDDRKNAEGGRSSGSEKGTEQPSFALQEDTGGPAQSYDEKLSGEIDFFMRHIIGGQLSEENASELKEKAEAMDYSLRIMVFGGEEDVLACVPNAGEGRIVRNIA